MVVNMMYHVLFTILNLLAKTNAYDLVDAVTQLGEFSNFIEELLNYRAPIDNEIFDFIVVGGGTAGSVVANRLSENPNWNVALIEAGGMENFVNIVPALCAFTQVTDDTWKYKTVPQERACFGMYNNECFHPRGRILGGTSSINFMIYNRGNHHDFDKWAEAGNYGWSYEEVLPYFRKSEMASLDGLEQNIRYHNTSGPLSVEYVKYRTEIAHAFIDGALQAGHPYTDYNGESQIGVSYVHATTKTGRRHSAYQAYIKPIMGERLNLKIFTYSHVTKILMDPETKSAYGVEFIYTNTRYTFKARKEVILSASSFNSPQLLMLSGIGPREHLTELGIDVIQELPVGKTVYEHASHFGPTFLVNTTDQTMYMERVTPIDGLAFSAGSSNTRLSSIGTVEALTFIKAPTSTLPEDWPDCEIIFASGSFASDDGTALKTGANLKNEIYEKIYRPLEVARQEHYSVLIMPFHPKSIGHVWLNSSNPFDAPMIDANYFENPDDVEVMLEGIKEAIRISQTPAMQQIGARLLNISIPGCESYTFGSDDYWRCSIRTMTYTLHHQVATCRMGPATDPTAVVSPELKVHGIRKLRVVDVSVIPFPPTSHTNAAGFMIGEKAADMIRGEW
ncbi:glucose dehydrogenase [FAD, quinone]-like [Cochliomyia hominivorax]